METLYSVVCFHFGFIVFAFTELRRRGLGLTGRKKQQRQKGRRKKGGRRREEVRFEGLNSDGERGRKEGSEGETAGV